MLNNKNNTPYNKTSDSILPLPEVSVDITQKHAGDSGSSSASFLDNSSSFWDYFNIDIYSKIHSFSLLQQWAFTNICLLYFILLCFITITNILWGDHLITKYNLDTKYPLLSKVFKYRSVMKGYRLTFNIILIYLAIIIGIIFNILVFII